MRPTMRTTRFAAAGLLLAALACNDQPAGPSDTTATLSPTRQWSGGTVTLQGALVREVQTGFTITAGSDTLPWTRLDDSTVSLQMPQGPSQTLDLQFRSPGYTGLLGQVDLAGFNSVTTADQYLGGELSSWPLTNPDKVLGVSQSQVATLDPNTGHVTALPALHYGGLYMPGLSYRSGVLLLPDTATGMTTNVWQLGAVPDSIGNYNLPDQRHVFELGPWRLLVTSHHMSWTTVSPDSGATWTTVYTGQLESPYHIVFSPDRSLVTLAISATQTGLPVINTATGDTVYTTSAVQASDYAVFSADNSTIYFTGAPQWNGQAQLTRMNAADGMVTGQVDLPEIPLGIALDPQRNRLYLPLTGGELLVADPVTLQILADLKAPAGAVSCPGGTCWDAAILVSRAGSPVVYVVPSGQSETQIIKYDLVD